MKQELEELTMQAELEGICSAVESLAQHDRVPQFDAAAPGPRHTQQPSLWAAQYDAHVEG